MTGLRQTLRTCGFILGNSSVAQSRSDGLMAGLGRQNVGILVPYAGVVSSSIEYVNDLIYSLVSA
jgi:hypothetical protein